MKQRDTCLASAAIGFVTGVGVVLSLGTTPERGPPIPSSVAEPAQVESWQPLVTEELLEAAADQERAAESRIPGEDQ